ncbi:GNAT family N-acetyltransferase [Streptomyces fulvorobeus]|uniref:N-acetyltransferase n=1 Tax=Streptomyces fulvorobeus TaxID=284028 RepID=A0A7J0BYP9_9ACTN|nr:GNAT family N-acetyltransferase [Streptomyces fulvorobeus]NYE39159.1 GNAT superfamily N-acetyltransferase [Streptomyces fulvorobeus]GFM95362.1 N-acetyltransferase [Streptomyces fulvorobeus]
MNARTARVRRARIDDLPFVAELAAEHARYEQAPPPPGDLALRLESLLFGGAAPRLRCFVAELGDAEIIGYASCAPEISTWSGTEYLHMDCLFLRDGHRGLGVGPMLMDAVRAEARSLGLGLVKWQTPAWNADAIRFYERLGAEAKEKRGFSLPVE